MARVLLDENIDRKLKDLFDAEFEVTTVAEQGWTGKKNGELLRLAAQTCDVFVTMDRKLEYQQNLSALALAVVVIRAANNTYAVVSALMPRVNEAIRTAEIGMAIRVTA